MAENDPEPKPGNKKSGWFLDKLAGPLVMLLIGTLLGTWWNFAAPELRYSTGEVIKFSGEKEEFGLFVISITNDGRKKAEQIRCEIDLGECQIQDLKAGPSILDPSVTKEEKEHKTRITISTLNQGEVLEIAIKASKPDLIRSSRRVSVRGLDVVGYEGVKSEGLTNSFLLGAVTASLSCFVALIMFLLLKGAVDRVRLAAMRTAIRKELEDSPIIDAVFERPEKDSKSDLID